MTNKMILKRQIGDWQLFEYETLDSTNEEIKRLVPTSGTNKILIISNGQTSGKGRHKRTWLSPHKSGLYASWLFFENFENVEILPPLVGLSCVKCLREIFNCDFFLKWPNDLVINGKKLGGVLIEKYKGFIIIGIGINLIWSDKFPPNAVSLDQVICNLDLSFEVLRNNLVNKLTTMLEKYLTSFIKNVDSRTLDEVCTYLSTPPGTLVSFIKNEGIFTGIVIGLSHKGELVVELENKNQVFLRNEEVSIQP